MGWPNWACVSLLNHKRSEGTPALSSQKMPQLASIPSWLKSHHVLHVQAAQGNADLANTCKEVRQKFGKHITIGLCHLCICTSLHSVVLAHFRLAHLKCSNKNWNSSDIYNKATLVNSSNDWRGMACFFRWGLWLGAMGSPSLPSTWTPWITCWLPSYPAGGEREATSRLWWSSSFISWRTSLKRTHPTTVLLNDDRNSVSGSCRAQVHKKKDKPDLNQDLCTRLHPLVYDDLSESQSVFELNTPCSRLWICMKPSLDHRIETSQLDAIHVTVYNTGRIPL